MTTTKRATAQPLSRAGHDALLTDFDKIEERIRRAEEERRQAAEAEPKPSTAKQRALARTISPARWDELKAALAPIEKIEEQHRLQAHGRKLDAVYALERKWLAEDEAALAGSRVRDAIPIIDDHFAR